MGQPRPLFRLFSVFSNKHYKFLQQIYVKKCPSSIRCLDLNPRPSERESPSITTRPGFPPISLFLLAGRVLPSCRPHLFFSLPVLVLVLVQCDKKKLTNVFKRCPKRISREKLKILTPIQNLPENVGDLGKLIVAKGTKILSKVQ